MKGEDHYILGHFLLKKHEAGLSKLCNKMFLLGCVCPDWNFMTYARGSLKYKFFHGHNADNVKKHLEDIIGRLEETGVHTPLQWLHFGIAIHYVADTFTFAHNSIFAGNIKEHVRYEKLLHQVLIKTMSDYSYNKKRAEKASHEQYMKDNHSYETDCGYILDAAMHLCERLNINWMCVSQFTSLPAAR